MRTALLPASLLAAALAQPCAAPAHADVLATIDKTTQRMSVAVDGDTRYVWPVSTGRPGYDTPNGTYHPFRMEADHFSKEWDDAPMPHSLFFTKIGHAIHGSLDTKHLGSAASHGCVRLSPQNASTLYALVEAEGLKDTTVVVAGRTPMAVAPGYDQQARAYSGQQPAPYYDYARPPQPYGAPPPSSYERAQPYYGQQPPAYYAAPAAVLCGTEPSATYGQPSYALPPQPPAPQFFGRPLLPLN